MQIDSKTEADYWLNFVCWKLATGVVGLNYILNICIKNWGVYVICMLIVWNNME